MALYLHNNNGDVQVKVGAGKLKGIFVSAASGSPTLTVYDTATASTSDPVILAVFTPAANTMYLLSGDEGGIFFSRGLWVDKGGTVNCTIFYE
tara:strand:- start:349 stop:627 length:279 start_codon:yes stop_codon:yes gene_type:complete